MEMPVSEIIDRYSILLLKNERVSDEDFEEELKEFEKEIPQNLLHFVADLYEINSKIWDKEALIRQGKDEELGLEEIGRRALAIRDLNRKRVSIKNEIVELTGQGFKDIKINHAAA